MGKIDVFSDMTGTMNQNDVNAQTLQQLVDEFNRNSDQLDAVTNNLAIVSTGKASLAMPGGVQDLTVTVNHGLNFPPALLASYTRSDDAMKKSYLVPNYVLDNSGNFLYYVIYTATSNALTFEINGNAPAVTFNFSYYLLKQPADLTNYSL